MNALVSSRKLAVLALIVCSLQSTVSADIVFSTDQPDDVSTQYRNFRRARGHAAQQQEDALKAKVRTQQDKPILEKISNFLFGTGSVTSEGSAPTPVWNYTRNGTDWDFKNCNLTTTSAQAPLNITNHDAHIGKTLAIHYVDWSQSSFYSFLPSYKPVQIEKTEVKDYAFTATLAPPTEGINALYAAEPHWITAKVIQSQVRWEPMHVKFHYPAEHALNNQFADVEMQIYNNDPQHVINVCTGGSAISIFFNVSDTAKPELSESGKFFDWMSGSGNATKMMDLSILMPKAEGQHTTIAGYVASDTVPPCNDHFCWYINEKVYRMTSEQYKQILVKDVPHNARQMNLSPMHKYQNVLINTGLFAEAPF